MAQAKKVTKRTVTPAQRVLDDKIQRTLELNRQVRLNRRIAALARSLDGAMQRAGASKFALMRSLALEVACECIPLEQYRATLDQLEEFRARTAELQRQLGEALDRVVSASV